MGMKHISNVGQYIDVSTKENFVIIGDAEMFKVA